MGFRLFISALFAATYAGVALANTPEVNVYSARQPFLIQPILKEFTKKTGIQVNTVFDKKGIEERLKIEGRASPADVVLTVDIGRLNRLVEAGVTQPLMTKTLIANIPSNFHAPDGSWWALTSRARVLYVSRERVQEGDITSYDDLASPKWRGKVCTRPGDSDYHVALTAAYLVHNGKTKTRQWLQGIRKNLAQRPQGNDRAQVKAVKEGLCDVAIGNSYYMAAMMNDPDQRPWAEAARIVFPNQKGTGTHVNVSGMALSRYAPHRENAVKLMEFLSSNDAQRMYADLNNEYPVKPDVPWSQTVQSWGTFKADKVNLTEVAVHWNDALRLINEVNFNAGL